ncbi:hypothetical protein [Pseudalkalibacillus caeni]|uniref:Antigen I/II N-terminal domain-containing protein n=1 Tax=Exobacillus caeni TaxID=2574798 RepID=A0A5R9F1W5_9BACL|nr:hypothetical protein [Pseudalkalibacillus caeni]TLS36460.1 hypothetical protein FCL54_14650 [Pseudalkalibacillus caeni]
MKKTAYTLLILLLTFLAACSSNEQSSTSSANNEESETQSEETSKTDPEESNDEGESVEVDKNLLSVEVKLPASMFEGESPEDIIAGAKEEGVKVTQNDDGSYTYKMSKSKHKEMMKELSTNIDQTVDEMKTSDDYASIKDITHNDDYSEFTMVVEKETYKNSMDGFATMGLGMSGMMYQLFDGAKPEEYSVKISLKDEASGEVFDEIVYPDAMEDNE